MIRRGARALLGALALGALLAGCSVGQPSGWEPTPAPETTPGADEVRFSHDGLERSFRVTGPDEVDRPLPVLVALHGAGGSAVTLSYLTGFDTASRDAGFLLVEPDGTGPDAGTRTWNAGTCCGTSAGSVDDIGFLEEVLDRVAAEHPVDPERIYLAGFSNGGMLAYRAACELGERIAGIAWSEAP